MGVKGLEGGDRTVTAAPVELESPDVEEVAEPDLPWVTIVWNDPVNLMSYVVYVLQKLFGYSREKATRLMLQVHHDGKAVVSDGSREKAEADVARLRGAGAPYGDITRGMRRRDDGEPVSASRLRTAATGTLQDTPRVDVDYLEVVDPDTFTPPDASRGEAADGAGDVPAPERLLVAVAAVVGPVRLIDNVEVGDLDDEERLLAATGAS
jgi:ATP-dependent Clp protease adaptor protein ClpS